MKLGFAWLQNSAQKLLATEGQCLLAQHGERVRATAAFSVTPVFEEAWENVGRSFAAQAYKERIRFLFEGLAKARIPFIYVFKGDNGAAAEGEGGGEVGPIEFELGICTWVDGRRENLTEVLKEADGRAKVLAASISVALPRCIIARMDGRELERFFSFLFWPNRQRAGFEVKPELVASLAEFSAPQPWLGRQPAPRFYAPNAAEAGSKGIRVGKIVVDAMEGPPLYLGEEELVRHVCVLGMAGSGKTTAAATICKRSWEAGIPALFIDWHSEYEPIVASMGGNVFSPGLGGLSINPLDPGECKDIGEHLALVTDIFTEVYSFTAAQSFALKSSLEDAFRVKTQVPTISDLVEAVEQRPVRSAYDNETKLGLLRRLVPLSQGQAGEALGGKSGFSLEELLEKPLALQLGHFADMSTRALVAHIVMKKIYDHMVALGPSGLRHITVFEEARFLFPPRRPEQPAGVAEKMLVDMGRFGEAAVLLAHFAGQLLAQAVKSAGVHLTFRLAWAEDVRLMREALGLTEEQARYLNQMERGEAIASTPRIRRPVLVRVDALDVVGPLTEKKGGAPPF